MREYIQEPGVRRWHGSELVSLQKETLDALEGAVAPYGNCVLKGCEITPGVGGTHNIAPGLVSILHPTDGQKVARFPGVSNVILDEGGAIYIKKTTTNKLYVDGINKPAEILYEAAWTHVTDGMPGNTCLFFSPAPPNLAGAMLAAAGIGWIQTTHTLDAGTYGSGTMVARRNPLLRLVHITGSITISGGTNPPTWTAFLVMPAELKPVRDVYFPCLIRYHTINPVIPAGEAASIPYFTQVNAAIRTASGSTTLGVGVIRAQAGASYTVHFSATYNLD